MRDFKDLIFAIPGAGKTVLAATALEVEEMCPILYWDNEGMINSIKSVIEDRDMETIFDAPSAGKLNRVRVKKWSEAVDLHSRLYDTRGKDIRDYYRTVIIDSMTSLNEIALMSAQGTLTYNLSIAGGPTQPTYGKSHWALNQLMSSFRDMEGINVIYTALTKDQDNVEKNIQMVKPNMQGQCAELICAKTEFVQYLYSDNAGVRWLQFAQKGKIYSNWRTDSGPAPSDLKEPTIKKILNLMEKN